MTEVPKQKIIEMRAKNIPFSQIAEELGVLRNTAKSFCQRESAKNVQDEIRDKNKCRCCGATLLHTSKSKPCQFCGDACRYAYWNKKRSKVSMPYKQFLGYEKGEDGKPKIVESEAKIVRQIYQLYLGGTTVRDICRALTAMGIPTPAGKEQWAVSTVMSILQTVDSRQKRYVQ